MKKVTSRFLYVVCAVAVLAVWSNAQTNKKAVAEITDLRSRVVEAIEKRDRRALDGFYADDFSHTHASGQVDDKKTRLDAFVSGDKTIDTAPAEDLKIKIFGDKTAAATGKSSVVSDDGANVVYRWTVVYAKIGKNWRVAASQATKLIE